MLNWAKGILALTLIAGPVITTGCAVHAGVGYRVYDPDARAYRDWDDHERVYYSQWAIETHREPNRDYRHLKHKDQREYWRWRNAHDHDHDHDDRR